MFNFQKVLKDCKDSTKAGSLRKNPTLGSAASLNSAEKTQESLLETQDSRLTDDPKNQKAVLVGALSRTFSRPQKDPSEEERQITRKKSNIANTGEKNEGKKEKSSLKKLSLITNKREPTISAFMIPDEEDFETKEELGTGLNKRTSKQQVASFQMLQTTESPSIGASPLSVLSLYYRCNDMVHVGK